jgi:hypothetical protein
VPQGTNTIDYRAISAKKFFYQILWLR